MEDSIRTDDFIDWLGVKYKTILSRTDTGGAITVVDSISPLNSGPPRHIHHKEDEIFIIVTGACRFWIEGHEKVAKAGESVFIRRGTEHTFKVISEEDCRHFVILTPGGFEGFFSDMAAGQFRIPEDMPAVIESATRHHMTFTGPPLD